MERKIVVEKPKCVKCGCSFSTHQMLEKHSKKKIPCDRLIECKKCLKKFTQPCDLKRHNRRKTPCEPIQGNPCNKTPNNSCHFCGKQFSNKSCRNRHFNVCKIKNGGMMLLFEKVERLTKINERLVEKMDRMEQKDVIQNGNQNINGDNNNVVNNHFNTVINIPLVCFGGDVETEKMYKIVQENLNILYRPSETDIPEQEQITNRIGEFVQAIYRNPEHKELQNVYTKQGFEKLDKDNAFTYMDEKWHIGDWDKVGQDILNKINLIMMDRTTKESVKKKEDVLNVMKTIMSAATGDHKITDENLHELYCEIGHKMGFATLRLEN